MIRSGFRLEDVCFSRGPNGKKRQLLKHVSALFEAGILNVIEGPIGAGKSTLLHLLAGLFRPTSGVIYAGVYPISRWTTYHRDHWRREVGVVLQSGGLIDDLTVRENVLLPLVPRCLEFSGVEQRVVKILEEFKISHLAEKNILSLSGGERQLTALAIALVGSPEYILVDEPTAHQDEEGFTAVLDTLRSAAQEGSTVVVVSHDSRITESGVKNAHFLLTEGILERLT